MKMNDNTILRIKVPAHLYEAVKAQLTLKEGKKDYGMPEGTVIKEKKAASDTKKAKTKAPKGASKAPSNTPKANQIATGTVFDRETEKMGAGVSETKKMGLEELKALAELLNNEITKLEEKSHDKEKKARVEEEKKKMEESMEYIDGQPKDATSLEAQMDLIWAEIDEIDAEIERLEPVLKTDEVTDEVRKRLAYLNQRRKKLSSQALDLRDEMQKK